MKLKSKLTDNLKSKIVALCYFIAVFVYLELALHLFFYPEFDPKLLYPVLFALVSGSVLYFAASLLPTKIANIAGCVIIGIVVIYFEVQLIYHCIFGSFMPLSQLGLGAGAITNFFAQMMHAILKNIVRVLLILLPLPLTIVLQVKKVIKITRNNIFQIPLAGIVCVFLAVVTVATLQVRNTHPASAYAILVSPNTSTETCVKTAGLAATTLQELKAVIDPSRMATSSLASTPVARFENDTKDLNALNINFNAMDDELSRYLSTVSPTAKNEYTGLTEGYNIVTICAEAFSYLVIDEELTPTLYKLANNGLVFKNFYSSFPNTTTNGEYAFNMGLFPNMTRDKVNNSFNDSAANYLPFCLGNALKEKGYMTNAYHNYFGTFYDRYITHPNMGYDFKAILNGLDIAVGYPTSDLLMMEASLPDFINSEEPFHVYYMTYSGHYQYNWNNDMSLKNKDKVAHLPYSDTVKAYIACNLELEAALTSLMDGLEAAGKADNTVIVLTTDHYPYGLQNEEYNELAGYEVDRSFEMYRNSFICYIPGIEPVIVEDYCSTPDILPTLLNLMGVDYDSRLLIGKDIMSNAPHVAVMADRSFITESFRYNAATGESIPPTDEATVNDYRNYVDNMFTISSMILETDYYSSAFNYEEEKSEVVNYEDITDKQIYVEAMATFMVNEGYIEPKSETMFGINDPSSIREFVEVLYRMGGPEGYESSMAWALETGLVTDESIVDNTATYADCALIMYRYMAPEEPVDVSRVVKHYPDIPEEMLAGMKHCKAVGIMAGNKGEYIYDCANTPITRYHLVAFLHRMYTRELMK